MDPTEKINIYVTEELLQNILQDCEYFHIEKNKKGEYIKNRFFTRLILGFTQTYINKKDQQYKEIKAAIEESLYNIKIKENDIKEIAIAFTEKMTKSKEKKRNGNKLKIVSYKPVKDTRRLLEEINEEITYSSYFNSLLTDYFSEPMAIRETILYKEIYDQISNYCDNQTPIVIYTNNDKKHKIIPYKFVEGRNGMFNYLLCGEIADTLLNNEENINKKMEARCYHLYSIEQASQDRKRRNEVLPDQIINQLNKMIKKGPEHAINSSETTIIKMTKIGHNLFNRIYNDRPIPDKKPSLKNDHYIYNFTDCSLDQLFFYFRRFGPEAEVIEPQSLRNRLIEFYEQSLSIYK